MHVPTHAISELVVRFVRRWIGGVTPEMLLDPMTVARMRAELKPILWRFYPVLMLVAFAAALLFAWPLIYARMALDGPQANAVLDGRSIVIPLTLVLGVLFAMLGVMALAEQTVPRRLVGWDRDLWTRYSATVDGWLPGRYIAFTTGCAVVISVPMLYFGWFFGDRVDDQGIAFMSGPASRRVESYSRVARIDLIRTTVGLNSNVREGLRVTFVDGSTWEYVPDPKHVTRPDQVARFIAARAGVPVGAP